MPEHNHELYKQPFGESIILTFFTLVLLMFSTSLIIFFCYHFFDIPMGVEPSPIILAIAVFFGLFISYLLLMRLSPAFFSRIFVPQLKSSPGWLALSVILGLLMSALVLWCAQFFQPPVGTDSTFEQIYAGGTLPQVLLLIAVVLLAPVGEEYLFRGVLLAGLSQRFSNFSAILLSSVVFMSFHLLEYYDYWYALAAIFILGILLAVLRLHSQSMSVPICCHASYNLIMLTLA